MIEVMKSYTDLEQSKKLAEILPIEGADMEYILEQWTDEETHRLKKGYSEVPVVKVDDDSPFQIITLPCWSLAALLKLIQEQHPKLILNAHYKWVCEIGKPVSFTYKFTVGDNPLDAVFKMVCYLKEKKMI